MIPDQPLPDSGSAAVCLRIGRTTSLSPQGISLRGTPPRCHDPQPLQRRPSCGAARPGAAPRVGLADRLRVGGNLHAGRWQSRAPRSPRGGVAAAAAGRPAASQSRPASGGDQRGHRGAQSQSLGHGPGGGEPGGLPPAQGWRAGVGARPRTGRPGQGAAAGGRLGPAGGERLAGGQPVQHQG